MGRVLVIGAGISGLTACKVLLDDGFDVSCVERHDSVAGCWNAAFDFVTLQNSRDEYHFPGVPFSPETPFRPGKADILGYWNKFVDRFDMRKHIRLKTEVVSLQPSKHGSSGWVVRTRKCRTDTETNESFTFEEERYEYIVVATGVGYGEPDLAYVPDIPANSFPGQVVHAVRVPCDELPGKDEKIVVVGFGSTSVGFANKYASNSAKHGNIHMVIQEPRWFVPTRVLGIIPHCSILYSRATGIMLPAFAHSNMLEKVIHLPIFSFFVAAFWWLIGLALIVSARPPSCMIPKRETALQGLRNAVPVLPDDLFGYCRSGQIKVHVDTRLQELRSNGDVALTNGEIINSVDRVVLCTGYTSPKFMWMSEELRSKVLDSGSPKQLYRHILVPGLDNIAFVGFASGFHGCVTEFVASNWVSSCFRGELSLPSVDEMEKDTERLVKWKKENVSYEYHYPYVIGARFLNYEDQLLQDMNVSPRLVRNPVAWLFVKCAADVYSEVPNLRRRQSQMNKLPLKEH